MTMREVRISALGILGLVLVSATSSNGNTIRSVKLEDLFREADVVAEVRILSGDGENYEPTVYKARVLGALKGTTPGATIYFGPSDTYGIGNEYLVFLRRSPTPVRPKSTPPDRSYGTISEFYEGMYSGFGIMEVEYTCVFGEDRKCDYGIRLNPEQVLLPKPINTFPQGDADARTNYEKWVYMDVLIHHLQDLVLLPER